MTPTHRLRVRVFIRSRHCKIACPGLPAMSVDNVCGQVAANVFGPASAREVFTMHFLTQHEGSHTATVAIQAHTEKFLSSMSNGGVSAFAEEVGSREQWSMEMHGDNLVAFKSRASGTYLVCDNLYDVRADRQHARAWEQWLLVTEDQPHAHTHPGGPIEVFLRSCRGKFACDGNPALKVNPDGRVQANNFGVAREWESLRMVTLPKQEGDKHGLVAFKTMTGKYLSAMPNGEVWASFAEEIRAWEKWTVEACHCDVVAFKSAHGRFLVCDNFFAVGDDIRADRMHPNEWEHWHLVPGDRPDAYTDPGSTVRSAVQGTVIAFQALLDLAALVFTDLRSGVGAAAVRHVHSALQSIGCSA